MFGVPNTNTTVYGAKLSIEAILGSHQMQWETYGRHAKDQPREREQLVNNGDLHLGCATSH